VLPQFEFFRTCSPCNFSHFSIIDSAIRWAIRRVPLIGFSMAPVPGGLPRTIFPVRSQAEAHTLHLCIPWSTRRPKTEAAQMLGGPKSEERPAPPRWRTKP
jgi:hypothetical protein